MNTYSQFCATTHLDVVVWRERQLEAAGFDEPTAVVLAGDCGFDLHRMIELVEAGCPRDLAVRILAPVDGAPHPC
jgi:hypothetical protein